MRIFQHAQNEGIRESCCKQRFLGIVLLYTPTTINFQYENCFVLTIHYIKNILFAEDDLASMKSAQCHFLVAKQLYEPLMSVFMSLCLSLCVHFFI